MIWIPQRAWILCFFFVAASHRSIQSRQSLKAVDSVGYISWFEWKQSDRIEPQRISILVRIQSVKCRVLVFVIFTFWKKKKKEQNSAIFISKLWCFCWFVQTLLLKWIFKNSFSADSLFFFVVSAKDRYHYLARSSIQRDLILFYSKDWRINLSARFVYLCQLILQK